MTPKQLKAISIIPHVTVAAIIMSGDKILLTQRAKDPYKGAWCLPGGHVDKGESREGAVIREVKEETDLDFTGIEFGTFDEVIPQFNIHNVVTVFFGTVNRKKFKKQESEVLSIKWFDVSETTNLSFAFYHRYIIREALNLKF